MPQMYVRGSISCEAWYHPTCTSLQKKLYESIRHYPDDSVKWYCVAGVDVVGSTGVKHLRNELAELINTLSHNFVNREEFTKRRTSSSHRNYDNKPAKSNYERIAQHKIFKDECMTQE